MTKPRNPFRAAIGLRLSRWAEVAAAPDVAEISVPGLQGGTRVE